MTRVLKCGVAGAGVFGGYHAQQYARMDGAQLAAVYDPHLERATALADKFGVAAFDQIDRFLAAVDLVSVTAPASRHAALARQALLNGRSVYVEKPVATTIEDAQALVTLAQARGLVMAVGHQERMVFRAMGLLAVTEAPLYLEAIRRGPFSDRNRDVSCVLDLMIHDIDLAFALESADVLAVEGEGRGLEPGQLDEVRAEATFESGLTAIFETSRIANARERRMRLVFPSGEIEIDFLERTFKNTTPLRLDPLFADSVIGKDPLGAALQAFVTAASGVDPMGSRAGPRDAIRALDLALAIEQACGF